MRWNVPWEIEENLNSRSERSTHDARIRCDMRRPLDSASVLVRVQRLSWSRWADGEIDARKNDQPWSKLGTTDIWRVRPPTSWSMELVEGPASFVQTQNATAKALSAARG